MNKKITDIQYNYLNLPSRIQFEDGNSISYLYDANGSKLHTTHVMDGDTLNTDYWGNAIYENGVLDKLMTGQGYITLTDTTYHYFLQDHQGNNRVIVNQDGAVEEVNHYYPFGGVFASTQSVQPFKYNGKELDRRNGLDWYDYGARHYDAALGRWHAMDPKSEKYYGISPYVYCNNNPVKNIDLDGRDWYMLESTGELYFNKEMIEEQIKYNEQTYVRIGGNDMLGNMNDITEKAYSFEESVSLAKNNGYNINPIQQIKSEESNEQPYKTGPNNVTITSGNVDIVNEKYGIFSADKDKVVGVKTETLYTKPYNIERAAKNTIIKGKETNYIERNNITYKPTQKVDKVYNAVGTIFGFMSSITAGMHDYRTIRTYNNWNDYSKATGGSGRMLKFKQK